VPDTSDLYTTVKNPTASRRFYGYVQERGKAINPSAEITVFGHLEAQKNWNKRKRQSLERDLLAGKVELVKTPAAVVRQLGAAAPLTNPTVAATVAAAFATTGGALLAGTYKVAYVFVNNWGRTLIGTSLSANFAQADNNDVPRVTLPALPAGADAIHLFVTDNTGNAATLRLYATGITTTTYDMTAALPALTSTNGPPTANTTAPAPGAVTTITGETLGASDPSWRI
jgi:hypothetical protein